jgi:TnpA family transposase
MIQCWKSRSIQRIPGGYTEHIFALCYLLGFAFMPRIKDLKDQQLYKIYRDQDYGELNLLLNKNADTAMVAEQWDQMTKVATSLKQQLAPANEIVRRLINGSPSDRLSKAFTNLGRIIKTEYILRYLTNQDLRRKIQRQLNKGEHRHSLARWIFFAHQGEFQTGNYEEIMNKASCLSLVSNAILYWNTIHISKIVEQLRAQGQTVSDEDLAHISLLLYKHVIPMGSYFLVNAHLFDGKTDRMNSCQNLRL